MLQFFGQRKLRSFTRIVIIITFFLSVTALRFIAARDYLKIQHNLQFPFCAGKTLSLQTSRNVKLSTSSFQTETSLVTMVVSNAHPDPQLVPRGAIDIHVCKATSKFTYFCKSKE